MMAVLACNPPTSAAAARRIHRHMELDFGTDFLISLLFLFYFLQLLLHS